MKILAADTSTTTGSVALLEEAQLVSEWTFHSPTTHNRRLLKTIEFLLDEKGWSLELVDGFAVTLGPGSFTGIRIGLSTMKALAWASGKPFVGVPTLDVLAAPLGYASLPVCTLLDARKQEVYYAFYLPDGMGNMERRGPYRVARPERVLEQINGPICLCGDGWVLYRDFFKAKLGERAVELPGPYHVVRASFLAEIAHRRFSRGDSDDPMTSVPLYVRPSEAELMNPGLARSMFK